MTRLADNAGGAGGWGGDSHPGSEPQATFDRADNQPSHEDWNPAEDYKFFYGNGQFHISDDHEFDDLASHANVPGDYAGPLAIGRVHVDMGKATFEVQANIHAQGLARILKDYCDQAGWRWGGMTDMQGEPVGTGSEFAPVTSYYYRVENDHLLLSRRTPNKSRAAGAVHVAGNIAYLHGQGHEGLLEWADDQGFTLVGANDNVLKRIEDLEVDNNYTPEWKNDDEHPLFQNEPDYREPSGVFRCPQCAQLFPSYRLYLQHRSVEDPIDASEPDPDGKFPELDMDATFPPNVSEPLKEYTGTTNPYSWSDVHGKWIPNFGPKVVLPDKPGMQDYADFGWRRPIVYDAGTHRVGIGNQGDYHSDVHRFMDNYNTGRPMRQFHEGWIAVDPHPESDEAPSDRGIRMRTGEEFLPAIQKALIPHEPYAAQQLPTNDYGDVQWDSDAFITGAANPQPKDLIQAPIPFLYDIQEDGIFVGQPGQRHSDIPGKFTPGGMVEGTYEPGGKVTVKSMTNMPYTVRHMLELWYYQHPEMEIKSVQMQDDAGNTTKLAEHQGADIGGFITALVGSDPTAFRASRALMRAGGKVYVVGGAVRDALLGKDPKDVDLMVTGLPAEEVDKALTDLPGRVDLTGKDFGVFRYNADGGEVEIALPRRERDLQLGPNGRPLPGEADHRMTPEEDLYRRDFTANAMAVDLDNGQLIDPFHGLEDLRAKRLRTLNTKSLSDDPLRTVRALVAMSKHGLMPTQETKDQMGDNAHLVQHLAQERVQAELDKLFKGDNPELALRTAIDTGVLRHVFPEVDRAVGHLQNNPHHELELGDHLLNVMTRAKQAKPDDHDFALAGLLHDIGKVDSHWTECRDCGWKAHGPHDECPECGSTNTSGHFYQLEDGIGKDHETVGAQQAYARLMALKYPKERAERIRALIQHHMFPAFTTEKGARKFLNTVGDHADDLLHLRQADQGGKAVYPTDESLSVDQQRELVQQVRNSGQAVDKSQLAINGSDVIQAGVPQGPQVGQVLQHLTDAVLENPELNTREGLLGLVRAWNSTLTPTT